MSNINFNFPKEPITFLYNPQNELLGAIKSELELAHIRVQICQQKLSGYYLLFENERIYIDNDGRIADWKEGFYDQLTDLLMGLM